MYVSEKIDRRFLLWKVGGFSCFLTSNFLSFVLSFLSFKMSAFLSSDLSTTFKTLVNTMAGDITGDAPVSRERFTAFSSEVSKIAVAVLAETAVAPATPTKAPVAAPTDAPKKAPRKATTTKSVASKEVEAALLAPVDSEPATLATAAPASGTFERDAYATHKSRLAKIDSALCMGRKIDEDNPLAGTCKGDAGATVKIYPEKQCSKKPLAGGKLCKICTGKDDEYKANTTKVPTGYFGRLDEPLFHAARVVGCDMFFAKYPNGLVGDPTTAPVAAPATAAPATATAAPATATATAAPATVAPATVAKAEEPKVKKSRAKKATTTTAPAEATTTVSVAATEIAPVEPEWVAFLFDDRVHMRNTKDGRVYEAHPGKAGRLEKVNFESYQGRWRDGALDIYAPEKETEE